mmetsp:Transcript_135387/g.239494  ORF Transcript_135387/g.239494 Transcript_135387/m.239494 type:complete len:304 (-) Transcript_135387:284-1195(-)
MAPKAKPKAKRRAPKKYSCPHSNDNVYHNRSGCPFKGSLEELHAHVGACPFEADEIARLAASLGEYCCKYPGRAVEALSLAREAVRRMMAGELDERLVEYRDKKPCSTTVKGLCTRPMLERLVGEELATLGEMGEFNTWQEFRLCCLPGFEYIRIPKKRVKGTHNVEDMLTSEFRGDMEPAEMLEECHRGEKWRYSFRVWMRALAIAEQMQRTVPDGSPLLATAVGATDGDASFLPAVLSAFRSWDTDGSGTISQEEMLAAFQKLDSTLPRADIDAMFGAADVNEDGFIDYVEFIAWVWKVRR